MGGSRVADDGHIRLAIYDRDPVAARAAGRLLNDGETLSVVATASLPDDLEQAVRMRPEALIVAEDSDLAAGIARDNPNLWVLLAYQTVSADLWAAARAAGIRAMLALPLDYAEVLQALRAVQAEDRRIASLSGMHASRRVQVAVQGPEIRSSQIIAVFGSKGGLGKSTLVTNLSAVLAGMGLRVVVLDWDLQSPDIATLYSMSPDRTLADWALVPEGEDLDPARIEGLLVRHRTGVWILPAPPDQLQAVSLDSRVFHRVLGALRSFADLIVVDLPTADLASDATVTGLAEADTILYIVSPDVAAIAEAGNMLATMRSQAIRELDIDPDKLRLVVSRQPRTGALPIGDLGRQLGLPALCAPLSDDPDIRAVQNRLDGQLPVDRLRGHPWAAQVRSLAAALVPGAPQALAKRPRRGLALLRF